MVMFVLLSLCGIRIRYVQAIIFASYMTVNFNQGHVTRGAYSNFSVMLTMHCQMCNGHKTVVTLETIQDGLLLTAGTCNPCVKCMGVCLVHHAKWYDTLRRN